MATDKAKGMFLRPPPPSPVRYPLRLACFDDPPFTSTYLFHLLRCLSAPEEATGQPVAARLTLTGGPAPALSPLFAGINAHLVPLALNLLPDLSFATAVSESQILPIATYGYCAFCQESETAYTEPLQTLERLYAALNTLPEEEAVMVLNAIEQRYSLTIPGDFDFDALCQMLVAHRELHPLAPLLHDTLGWLSGNTGSCFTDLCGTCLYQEDGYSLWEAAYHGDCFLSLDDLCWDSLLHQWQHAQALLASLEALQQYGDSHPDSFLRLWEVLMCLYNQVKFPHVTQLSLPFGDHLQEAA